jgi:hypothetical protein
MTARHATILGLALMTAAACAAEADGSLPAGDDPAVEQAADVPTTEAPSTSSAPTTTVPLPPGFEDGTHLVGTDVQPGRYTSGGALCYWERRSGTSGTFEEIIVNGNAEGQAIVDIPPGDVAFASTGCDRWTVYAPPDAPVTEFGPGDWVVGEQIAPGTYRADAGLCAWERATSFRHDYDEILDYGFPDGPVTVEIQPGDVRFTSTGCGTWTPA